MEGMRKRAEEVRNEVVREVGKEVVQELGKEVENEVGRVRSGLDCR